MWVYTNSPTWELIGNNTPTWKRIGTVTWVYTNTLTRELNRYRPDQTRPDQTGPDRQTHFKSFQNRTITDVRIIDSEDAAAGAGTLVPARQMVSVVRTIWLSHGNSRGTELPLLVSCSGGLGK